MSVAADIILVPPHLVSILTYFPYNISQRDDICR